MAATRAVIVCSYLLSVGKWRILRLLFTFVLACSWVLYLVLLSRWVPYHGVGMYQLFWCTQYRRPGIPFTCRQRSLKVCGKALSLATVSPQVSPYSWSLSFSLCQASNWAFNTALTFAVPPGLNTIIWKTYFIFESFNFAAFLQVYFMYPETVSRSLEEVDNEIFSQGAHCLEDWKDCW